jgi:1-acyl-sn-glycerol-3-phosphate acyltransferase
LRETSRARLGRRSLTIPGTLLAFALLVLSLPLSLPIAALADVALRRRWATTRFLGFGLGYLGCEMLGLAASLALWLYAGPFTGRDRERYERANFRLQLRWASALLTLAQRLYGLRIELDLAEVGDRTLLVFVRHASLVDALLPTVFVSARDGTRLRFVLKRELLLDPCLDVVGQRLPNAFVARGTGDPAQEEESIRRLARELGPREGVVIFPEGTRFSPDKRVAALERVRASGDRVRSARVGRFRHVLPPRSRGALALLDAAPQAEVLFLAHHGLEGTGHPLAILRGDLIGRRIRIRTWRVPVSSLPAAPADRLAWLDGEWAHVDDWIEAGIRLG